MLPIAQLYQVYGKRVFNLAYRITGNRATAEDVLHEVFIRIIEHADQFRGDGNVYSWIFTITKNLCLRSRKRSFRGFEKLIEAADRPAQTTFNNELERRYYVQQVKDGCLIGLLKCLSFYQRIAFILDVLYRVPVKTVAAILNKSQNSVRILVSRARANLKAFLCSNCSLYAAGSRCRCDNMVEFSLRNAWITRYNPKVAPAEVESELNEFKSEVLLYQSLLEQDPPPEMPSDLLARHHLTVLSREKMT